MSTTSALEITLLGPLSVRCGDAEVPVSGTLTRRLLTVLALNAGHPVPTTQLMELLWADEPPAAGLNALQQRVSSLRRALRPCAGDAVSSIHGGYQLNVARSAVDALALEDTVATARAANAEPAYVAAALDVALARWTDDPVPEIRDTSYGTGQVSRLVSLHAQAVELRAEVGLAMGQESQLESLLTEAVRVHPFDERLRGQLMVVLARLGRQADALALYHVGRELLADDLGIDPSPELQAVFQEVLAGNVGTSGRPGSAEAPGKGPPSARRRDGDRRAPAASPVSSPGPRWATRLIGRDHDVTRISHLLKGTGIVTLTGPGGVGKTRLAAAAGDRVATDRGYSLAFVDLSPLIPESDIEPSVMTGLGLLGGGPHTDGGDSLARIVHHLQHDRRVLVLDNCEHVVDSAARVVEAVTLDTDTLVLSTSREPLGVGAETVWSVPPLPVPPPEASQVQVLEAASVRLFLDRAARSAPDEPLGLEQAELLGELARRLDGVPLALELAAGRLRTFGLRDLVDQLEHALSVLTHGPRTAPPRQQTLRGAVEWSYQLLTATEQDLFRRLAVFAGPFTGAAAAAVAGAAEAPRHALAAVTETLLSLVDRSLLSYDRATGRYRMLHSVADFALEQLEASGDAFSARQAMISLYCDVAHDIGERGRGPAQAAARRRARDDHANLVHALLLALDRGFVTGAAAAPLIAGELWWAWLLNDDRIEARRYLDAALAAPGLSAVDRGRLLLGAAFLDLDRYQPAGPEVQQLSALARDTGEASLQGWADLFTAAASAAISTRMLPTFVPADRRRQVAGQLDAAAEGFSLAGNTWALALTEVLRAVVALTGGDGTAALPHLEAAEVDVVALGDPWLRIKHTQTRGIAAMLTGNLRESARFHSDALTVAQREALRESQATLHSQLGGLALAAGELGQARHHFDLCLSLVERLGIVPAEAWPRNGLGVLERREGRPVEAVEHHRRALELYASVNHRVGVPYSRALLGIAHSASGHRKEAGTCLQLAFDEATANDEPAVAALALVGLAEAAVPGDRGLARRRLADARRLLASGGDRSPLVPLPGTYELDRVTALLRDSSGGTGPRRSRHSSSTTDY